MNQVFRTAEEKMNKTVSALENEYTGIRAGRANPAVLNKLTVEYYGAPTPVNQLASVSVPEPRTLMIQPYDKSALKDIEKAILTSDIGLNPQNDGSNLRLIFPPLTEERRKDLGKTVLKYAEEAKISVRSVRRDAIDRLKDMKKKAEITEDDLKNAFTEAQAQTADMRKALRSTEKKLRQVNEQIHYTGQYLANKSVYRQYLNSRNKKKFRQEHQTEITLYETARKVLKGYSEDGKLPSMKLLKAEKEKLTARKNSQYDAYQNLRKYVKELNTVQANLAAFLGKDRSRQNEQEKDNARS